MTPSFTDTVKEQNEAFSDVFAEYRDQLTDVLFYGERISRSELTEGKDEVLRRLRHQIKSVQEILLPAVTNSEEPSSLSGVELFASVQDRLLTIAEETEENVEFFANPDAPKDDRNDAAREILKDLYRLDSSLSLYLELLENHLLEAAERELDEDEKDELLQPFAGIED